MSPRRARLLFVHLVLLGATACRQRDDSTAVAAATLPPRPPPPPPSAAPPPAASRPSDPDLLEDDVNALLHDSCTPCHTWTASALVRSASACRSGGPLVVPGDPERSPLYQKIAGTPECGGPMPPSGSLPRGGEAAVRAWILGGAPLAGGPPAPPREDARAPEDDLSPVMN